MESSLVARDPRTERLLARTRDPRTERLLERARELRVEQAGQEAIAAGAGVQPSGFQVPTPEEINVQRAREFDEQLQERLAEAHRPSGGRLAATARALDPRQLLAGGAEGMFDIAEEVAKAQTGLAALAAATATRNPFLLPEIVQAGQEKVVEPVERAREKALTPFPEPEPGLGALPRELARVTPHFIAAEKLAVGAVPRLAQIGRTGGLLPRMGGRAARDVALGVPFTVLTGEAIEHPSTMVTTPLMFGALGGLFELGGTALRQPGRIRRAWAERQAGSPFLQGEMPSSLSRAAEAGGLATTSRTVAPPRTQPSPSFQVSAKTVEPSVTSRATAPPPSELGPPSTRSVGDIDPTSSKIILQPSAEINEMVGRAEAYLPRYRQELAKAVEGVEGAEVVNVRAKSRESTLRKTTDQNRPVETVSDLLGGRVAIDSPAAAEDVIGRLRQRGYRVIEDENFIGASKHFGYRARHVNLMGPNGEISVELQLVPREVAEVQEAVHRVYERLREPGLPLEEFRALEAEAREVFDRAWARYRARVGEAAELEELAAEDVVLEAAERIGEEELNRRAATYLQERFLLPHLERARGAALDAVAREVVRGGERTLFGAPLPGESVGGAAIRVQGQIFTGASHADARLAASKSVQPEALLQAQEGFTTSHRNFVGREEALAIAQAEGRAPAAALERGVLRSEDLRQSAREAATRPAEGRAALVDGGDVDVLTNTGGYPGRYALIEAEEILPSHQVRRNFAPEPRYPEGVQERQYHRDPMEAGKVQDHARRWDHRWVISDNADAVNGPPIILENGIVLGGNSRAMTQQLIYAEGRGDIVRQALKVNAPRFGIEPAQVDAMREPILVRVLDTPPDRLDVPAMADLVRAFNESPTQALASAAASVAQAKRVSPETLEYLGQSMQEGQTLNAYLSKGGPTIRELAGRLQDDGVLTAQTLNQYVSQGQFTREGRQFVERLMRGVAVPDATLLDIAPAAWLNTLDRAIPSIATARAVPGYDLTEAVTEALEIGARMRATGEKLADVLGQGELFGEAAFTTEATSLARMFDSAKPTAIRDAFARYAAAARAGESVARGQTELLGLTAPPLPPEAAFREAFAEWLASPEGLRAGVIDPRVTRALARAGGGAAVGAAVSPEDRAGGALAGAAIGVLGPRALRGLRRSRRLQSEIGAFGPRDLFEAQVGPRAPLTRLRRLVEGRKGEGLSEGIERLQFVTPQLRRLAEQELGPRFEEVGIARTPRQREIQTLMFQAERDLLRATGENAPRAAELNQKLARLRGEVAEVAQEEGQLGLFGQEPVPEVNATPASKVEALEAGRTIEFVEGEDAGKRFTVLAANRVGEGPKMRTDIRILEEGAERYGEEPGRFLAEGEMIPVDRSRFMTVYADQPSTRRWRILEEAEALEPLGVGAELPELELAAARTAEPGQRSFFDLLEEERGVLDVGPEPLAEHSQRIQSHLGDPGPPPRTLIERVEDLYATIFRRTAPIERAERQLTGKAPGTALAAGEARVPPQQSAAAAARLAQGSSRRAEAFLEYGPGRWTADGELQPTGTPGLREILESVRGRRAAFERYEVAARTLELEPRGIETGISPRDARAEVAAADEALTEAHRKAVQFRRANLQYWADAGGVSPEALEAMERLGEDYVPLYRVFQGKDVRAPGGGPAGRVSSPIRRLVGSRRKIAHPILSTIDQTRRIVQAADQQRVALRLVEMAEANPEAAIGILQRVQRRAARGFSAEAERLQQAARTRGVEMSDDVASELAETLSNRALTAADNTISVWRNGKLERWRVEPRLFNGLMSLGPQKIEWWARLFGVPAQVMKAGITLNPMFQAFNFIRDTFDATLQSRYGFRLGVDSFRGFYEAARAHWLGKAGRRYQEFALAGGGFASFRGRRVRSLRATERHITPRTPAQRLGAVILHPVEALKAYGAPFEEAARLGEYLQARSKDANMIDAFLASQDVTVNFLEMGAGMGSLSHMTAFLNPAMQSLDRSMRVLGAPITRGQAAGGGAAAAEAGRLLAHALGAISIPSALLWAANRDDQEIADLRKTNAGLIYWFVRDPKSGQIIRVPKPFLWGQVFGTGMEAALDRALEEDPQAMERWVHGVREQLTATVLPNVLQMYIEQVANRDMFFQSPIVPEGMEDVLPQYQVAAHTGTTARTVAEWAAQLSPRLAVSPARLEHMWGDFTGTLGREGLQLMDQAINELSDREASPPAEELTDLFLVGRFFARQTTLNVEPIRTFYDRLNEYERVARTLDHLEEEGRVPEAREHSRTYADELALLAAYRATARKLRQIRGQVNDLRSVPDRALSRERKREIQAELYRQAIETARRVNDYGYRFSSRDRTGR